MSWYISAELYLTHFFAAVPRASLEFGTRLVTHPRGLWCRLAHGPHRQVVDAPLVLLRVSRLRVARVVDVNPEVVFVRAVDARHARCSPVGASACHGGENGRCLGEATLPDVDELCLIV